MSNYDNEKTQEILLEMLKEVNEIAEKNNIKYYLAYGTALGAIRHRGFIPWDTDIDIIVDIDNYFNLCKVLNKNLDTKFELKSIETDKLYDSLKARVSLKGYSHNLIHVDIFPIVGTPEKKISKRMFSIISYLNYRSFFVKKVNPKINYKNNKKKKHLANLAKFILLPISSDLFIRIFNKLSKMHSFDESTHIYNICGSYGMKEYIPKKWLGSPEYVEFESKEFPVPQNWDKYLTHIYGDYMTPKKTNYV